MKGIFLLGLFSIMLASCGVPQDFDGATDGHDIRTIVLDSADDAKRGYSFSSDAYAGWETADIINEPWCTDEPGICGNWVEAKGKDIEGIGPADIPVSGYISDVAGFDDCQNVEVGALYVNRNRDSRYYAFTIVDDDYSESEYGCNHRITVMYKRLK